MPATAALAWLVIIPAIVIAIIALVRKAAPKGLAIAAVIVAPVAWLIAIIVASAAFISGVNDAVSHDPAGVAPSESTTEAPAETPAEEASDEATVGQTVTNSDNVSVTFTAVTCGLAEAGPEFLAEQAKGQFCEVTYHVQNDSDQKISLWASDVTGEIDGIEYESNGTVSTFGGDYFTTDLNPGLGTDAVVYIDIPADKALNYVVFAPQWSFLTSDIRVKVS